MPSLCWSEAMSVGVPALDTDHKCLVRIISLLEEAQAADAASVVETVLETLILYARFHFEREEKVMEACGFSGLTFHRSEHAGFTRFIRSMRERFSGVATQAMAGELFDYLRQWLLHHVLIQDMAYKPAAMACDQIEEIARGAAPPLERLRAPAPA